MRSRYSSRWMVLLLAIAFMLLLPGCSFIVDLYVMNLSGKVVLVSYELPPGQYSQFSYRPQFFPVEGSDKYYSLGPAVHGKFEADSLKGKVWIELQPGHAVRIGETMNYYPDLDTTYQWRAAQLQIIRPSAADTLIIPGDSLGHHFVEMPGRIYAVPVR